jgi:hypothetical protein
MTRSLKRLSSDFLFPVVPPRRLNQAGLERPRGRRCLTKNICPGS